MDPASHPRANPSPLIDHRQLSRAIPAGPSLSRWQWPFITHIDKPADASGRLSLHPLVSHEKLIEDNKPDYYLALHRSQSTFQLDILSVQTY